MWVSCKRHIAGNHQFDKFVGPDLNLLQKLKLWVILCFAEVRRLAVCFTEIKLAGDVGLREPRVLNLPVKPISCTQYSTNTTTQSLQTKTFQFTSTLANNKLTMHKPTGMCKLISDGDGRTGGKDMKSLCMNDRKSGKQGFE